MSIIFFNVISNMYHTGTKNVFVFFSNVQMFQSFTEQYSNKSSGGRLFHGIRYWFT